MKYLKMCLVAPLAIFLISFGGVGTASATKLCTNSSCSTEYALGTHTHFEVKVGTTVKMTSGGSTIATCTEWKITGTTTTILGVRIWLSKSTDDYTSCSQETRTIANGEMAIERTSGTNGSVIDKGSEWTVQIFGTSCTYGTGEGNTLGTLVGGETPILAVNTTVNRTAGGFLCPTTVGYQAELVVTEPHALFVGS